MTDLKCAHYEGRLCGQPAPYIVGGTSLCEAHADEEAHREAIGRSMESGVTRSTVR